MLIRSQDKTVIINLDNVSKLYVNNFCVVALFANSNTEIILGEYNSKSQTIEILNMLQNQYQDVFCVNNEGRPSHFISAIFEMP